MSWLGFQMLLQVLTSFASWWFWHAQTQWLLIESHILQAYPSLFIPPRFQKLVFIDAPSILDKISPKVQDYQCHSHST
jgi:hypothetical protein